MNHRIMKHLLWKDARSIGPLAIAIPALVVVFFILLTTAGDSARLDVESELTSGYSIWCLMPILVAYGAPAVLVGGEEESGSLAWLRTLPAPWRSIAASKLIVVGCCLSISWFVSTACFVPYLASIDTSKLHHVSMPEPFLLHLVGNVGFSFALALVSFSTAYFFRSPVTALVAVLPVLLTFITGLLLAVHWIEPINVPAWSDRGSIPREAQLAFALGGALLLLVFYGMHQFLAFRRLTRPLGQNAEVANRLSEDAFRPPATQPVTARYRSFLSAYRRPSPTYALLYQHVRQMGWPFGLLMSCAVLALVFAATGEFDVVPVPFVAIALLSVGALTFYGDSVNRRCQFLADRGISPTLVWLTRLAPMGIVIAFAGLIWLIISVLFIGGPISHVLFHMIGGFAVTFASFALAQAISQWSPRPVLSLFATPVFIALAAFALAPLFSYYQAWTWILFVSGIILLYASWKMTPHWMRGDSNRGTHLNYAAYALLALLLPYFLVTGFRWAGAPWGDTQWRTEMMAFSLPARDAGRPPLALLDTAYRGSLNVRGGSLAIDNLTGEEYAERLSQELEDEDSIGEHLTFEQVLYLAEYGPAKDFGPSFWEGAYAEESESLEMMFDEVHEQLQLASLEVLMKWSRVARRQATEGTASLNQLFGISENADKVVATVLYGYLTSHQFRKELDEGNSIALEMVQLAKQLPSQQEVTVARRNSLIRDWRKAQAQEVGSRQFAGRYSSNRIPIQWWLVSERVRADRWYDRIVKQTLESMEPHSQGLSFAEVERIRAMLLRSGFERNLHYDSYAIESFSDRLRQAAQTDQLFAEIRRLARSISN